MELLDVTLTRLQRRNRVAFVAQDAVSGALLPGDAVVLRDEEGEYFAGTVLDETVTAAEARYVVKVGVRLPEEYALKRLGVHGPAEAGPVDAMQDLLDLLGEARAMLEPRRVPTQRTVR